MDRTIKLELSHDKIFIWSAEDAHTVRESYRIIGTLVGCLPRAPRQNSHLGLPLQLMPEEAKLLLDKGSACLVDGKSVSDPDTEKECAFKDMRAKNHQDQIDLFRQDRKREIYRNMNKIIEGKRAKRQKLIEERKKSGEKYDEQDEEMEEDFDVEKIPIPPIAVENTMVQIFTDSPWKDTRNVVTDRWLFPQTETERVRYRVFSHLWEKGYYLTGGGKFGGDFLVYPGDPSRFHSFYIAICKNHQEKITALDIISMGRLGSNVKKTVLLCSVNSHDQVVCTSLQWTGIS